MITIPNYIDGSLIPPRGGAYIEDFEPAIGQPYALVPDSDERDVETAVEAAERASSGWASLSLRKRSDFLLNISRLIEANTEELAQIESRDTGKPVSLARTVDIPRAAQNFHFFATALLHFSSESHATDAATLNYTLRDPLGPVACISPWNLPLYLLTWKIAPALAAGNCVVAKPSEFTPMTAYRLSELCLEAGLPPGVLNIVHGLGAKTGAALTAHPSIKAISFTGGTQTGAEISRTAAPMFKKLSLELGGKNPTVVFADCDFNAMMETTMRSAFSNQGEICLCGSRILIEKPLYDRFKAEFISRISALRVGDPQEESTDFGSLVSLQHMEKVLSYIELAKEEGGKVLCGGGKAQVGGRCNDGYFVSPTVVEGLPQTCRTNREEIFGPVVTLQAFSSDDEAIALANDTEYGLAAGVWTQNLNRAQRVAKRLQMGVVWINCWMLRDLRTPFGGVKSSGVGREGGLEALRFFTEPKNVCIKI